jgi:hypothetical protein
MANMHVLGAEGGGAYRIVCHYAIPATTNSAGLAWRTAYARSRGWPADVLPTVLPDGDGTLGTISAADKATVTGTLPSTVPTVAEETERFDFPSDWTGLSGAQRQAVLDAWYAAQNTEWTARLQALLLWWGYTR